MYIQDFLVKLEKKEAFPPLIVFAGEAEDIKAEGLARLKQCFRTRYPSGRLHFVDGGAEDLISALDDARTPSLFHEPKLIVFLNAQKALNADTAPSLASYLESPVEDHILVFLRKDSKSAAVLKKSGWSVYGNIRR